MRIDDHIIREDLLKVGDWVLDAGCLNFGLHKELGEKQCLICIDPNKDIVAPPNVRMIRAALGAGRGVAYYYSWGNGEGNHIAGTGTTPYWATDKYEVQVYDIQSIMDMFHVKQFGLIKLDIEGSEYDVLLGIDQPIARQIAVEFHQQLGHNKYGTHEEYMDKLMASPFGRLYEIAEWERRADYELYEYLFLLKGLAPLT